MDLSCISKSNSLRRTAKDKNGQLEEINALIDDKLNKLKAYSLNAVFNSYGTCVPMNFIFFVRNILLVVNSNLLRKAKDTKINLLFMNLFMSLTANNLSDTYHSCFKVIKSEIA